MKPTGITRKVDELGRIVIPKELRDVLGIKEKDPMEIFSETDKIVLKKYTPNMACSVTGEILDSNCEFLNGKLILSPKGAEILIQEIMQKMWIQD